MNEHRNRRGFTMAEMLIVVAIIGVLAAVSFVAVAQHQRSLERLERDSVAREIFVAAQNHLTMAKGLDYLKLTGNEEDVYGSKDSKDGVYYFTVYQADKFSPGGASNLLDLMLPFGAIDETVRAGGSYIIRYHRDTATVMDVFYCSTDDRYGYNLQNANIDTLLAEWTDGKEAKRRNFNQKVLGWYGGVDAETLALKSEPLTFDSPILKIENAERLRVMVQDPNSIDHDLQIIITGVTSGAKKAYSLKATNTGFALSDDDARRVDTGATIDGDFFDYVIVLDDITQPGLHFADLRAESGEFQPGEDIAVQAVAYNNTAISNIAYSVERITNSLYGTVELGEPTDGKGNMSATIGNIRHLENLDKNISGVGDLKDNSGSSMVAYSLQSALQTNDLIWMDGADPEEAVDSESDDSDVDDFVSIIGGTAVKVYPLGEDAAPTEDNCYYPISPDRALSYDGQGHSVSNIKVNYAGDAGLFGAVAGSGDSENPTVVKNLALIDFDIAQGESSEGNAGTLAGTLTNVDVINVIAYDRDGSSRVAANSGNAGGLVGSATGCRLSASAASVYVSSATGDAGGLAGTVSGGGVSGCYAGGHTSGGAYGDDYNVSAPSGNAGGLVGFDTNADISHSYSTCSVTGQTAGGFVATATANFTGCYATGLVLGTGTESITETVNGESTASTVPRDGAFAYSLSGSASGCGYLEIINERADEAAGYACLTALGKKGVNAGITPIDATVDSYDAFMGAPAGWERAAAYDDKLIEYYSGAFPLQTVGQLGADIDADSDFVAIHFGDWPAPEIFVVNQK